MIFVATYLVVPLNIRFSRKYGFVALPSERRIHSVSHPEAGGLSFGLFIIIGQLVMGLLYRYQYAGISLLRLCLVGILAILLGLIDDKYESRARYKLLWQIALGLMMYFFGYRVNILTNLVGDHFVLGWLSLPATVFWYVMVINAINLIDGLDGLACGITIIVSTVLMIIGLIENNILTVVISAFLLTGNLAFLRYNFYPARIFMGDTGSLFIGLNLAAISTAGTAQYKGITSMTLIVPLGVMAIPIIDVWLAVVRRIGTGNIFKGDKAHIHHIMMGFGLSQKSISIIVYIVTILFGLIAIGFSLSSKKIVFALLLIFLALMVVAAYLIMRQEQKK